MSFLRHIASLAAAFLAAASTALFAQASQDSLLRARLLSELDSLQSTAPVTDILPADLPPAPAGEVIIIDENDQESIAPDVSSDVWRLYMEKADKADEMAKRIRRLERLIADKKSRLEALPEGDRDLLNQEISLLEEMIPLLQGEHRRLIKERDEYEIRFVGGPGD